jgi:hypothetical protein
MKINASRIAVIILLATLLTGGTQVFAQGTGFTYQGRLNQGGTPVTGLYDFQFTVFDAPTGGSGQGMFPLSATLPVSNGLFTLTMDPGPGVFTGPSRWLAIAVRTNGAGSYSNLSPRQLITSAPYAVRSANAALASGVLPGSITASSFAPGAIHQVANPSGSISNALNVDATGLVGIGTGTSAVDAGLHVSSSKTILSPVVLSSLRDETGGYTNLASVGSMAILGNLMAIGGQNESGITLVDIANPQAPVLLSQFRNGEGAFTNLGGLNALALKTNLLAAGTFGSDAITLISVTNPSSPVKLAEIVDGVGGWNELNAIYSIAIRGNLMAIAALEDSAVTLADISNPSNPIKRIEIKDGAFGFTNLGGAVSVDIQGNLLAVGAFYDNAVTLIDITDPANPIKLSELRDGVGGFNNLTSVFKVALSPNGLLAISGAYDNAVTLVDVSNPANPVKLAELVDGVNGVQMSVPTGLAFSGNRLAAAGAGGGTVTLFDISNPMSPQILSVVKDGVAGFHFVGIPALLGFAGTNLVIPSTLDDAVTLVGFAAAEAGIISENWVGIGTTAPRAALDVLGDVIVDNANFFDVNAVRIELGIGTTASGSNAVAMGRYTLASGESSTALGGNTKARGLYATAFGYFADAIGNYSIAGGNSVTASNDYSVALGGFSMASGLSSFVAGYQNSASGDYSAAIGYGNGAKGFSSIALGFGNTTSSNYSLAAGYNNQADGPSSISLGRDNNANGAGSVAIGDGNSTFGDYGVALGFQNSAGANSMAVGSSANANQPGSFVWADSSIPNSFSATAPNQFLIRAAGGVGINTNTAAGAALHVRGNALVNGTVTATNFVGRFTGNGAGLTNVPGFANVVFTYDLSTQPVASVGVFQDVTFGANANIGGWTHPVGTAFFTNSQTGLYLVQYTAQVETSVGGASSVSLRATLNGTEIAGSQASADPEAANVTIPVSKSFLVSASAGATLKLQLTGTSVNNRIVAGNGAGTERPSISMTIIRIQ